MIAGQETVLLKTMAWTDDLDDLPMVYEFGRAHGRHDVLSVSRLATHATHPLRGLTPPRYSLLSRASCRNRVCSVASFLQLKCFRAMEEKKMTSYLVTFVFTVARRLPSHDLCMR